MIISNSPTIATIKQMASAFNVGAFSSGGGAAGRRGAESGRKSGRFEILLRCAGRFALGTASFFLFVAFASFVSSSAPVLSSLASILASSSFSSSSSESGIPGSGISSGGLSSGGFSADSPAEIDTGGSEFGVD